MPWALLGLTCNWTGGLAIYSFMLSFMNMLKEITKTTLTSSEMNSSLFKACEGFLLNIQIMLYSKAPSSSQHTLARDGHIPCTLECS